MFCEIKTQWGLVLSFTTLSLLDQLGTWGSYQGLNRILRYIYLHVSLISS